MNVQLYKSNKGVTAYKQRQANDQPALFLLSGHRSTFNSSKRDMIESFADKHDVGFTHFTYHGWGQSSSSNVPEGGLGYIQQWLEQSLDVFDNLTVGPQIVIGHSMGGYMALALAQARPDRVKGVVGLASGFGTGLVQKIKDHYRECRVGTSEEKGFAFEPDAENALHISDKLKIDCPVRLLHSMADDIVNSKNTECIAKAVNTKDVIIRLTKDGDHSMHSPRDIMWLEHALAELIAHSAP